VFWGPVLAGYRFSLKWPEAEWSELKCGPLRSDITSAWHDMAWVGDMTDNDTGEQPRNADIPITLRVAAVILWVAAVAFFVIQMWSRFHIHGLVLPERINLMPLIFLCLSPAIAIDFCRPRSWSAGYHAFGVALWLVVTLVALVLEAFEKLDPMR
jgi:hypothetical protein